MPAAAHRRLVKRHAPPSRANQVSAAWEFALAMEQRLPDLPGRRPRRPATFPGSPDSAAPAPPTSEYQPSCSYLRRGPPPRAPPTRRRAAPARSAASRRSRSATSSRRPPCTRSGGTSPQWTGGRLFGPRCTRATATRGPDRSPTACFYGPERHVPNQGGHGQLLVGYDSTRWARPASPRVTLLVQNSYRHRSGRPPTDAKAPRGTLYWSYETFLKPRSSSRRSPIRTIPSHARRAPMLTPHATRASPVAVGQARVPVGAREARASPAWLIFLVHRRRPRAHHRGSR